MDIINLNKKLTSEGFKHIYEWRDQSNTEYPLHSHQDKVSMYILAGSLVFNFGDKIIEVKTGERFDVPPKTEHTAKVGTEGCHFLVGEMIEGDS